VQWLTVLSFAVLLWQAAETGFEMLHTHVNPTNLDPAYLTQVKADHDYIHAKGLLTGTYVLLQNPPGLNASTEIIDPETGQPEGTYMQIV
jgi:hypothetical protein